MEKLSETEWFEKLYAYFESNKVRQSVKKSVSDISVLTTNFSFEDIPKMSDETIKASILSTYNTYWNPIIASVVSWIFANYFWAFNRNEENRILKKTDEYLSLYTEYILRQLKKCREEFRILWIKDIKINKILEAEAIILDEEEKYELFKNILNLQFANQVPKNKMRYSVWELCQDIEFRDFIKEVRIIIFGNTIEFTQDSLISNKNWLLDIFDIRERKIKWLSMSSKIIWLEWNIKINLVWEKQEDESYNTYLHELWHAAEWFITNIIWELLPDSLDICNTEEEFGKSKVFKKMRKEDILIDFERLKTKNPQLYNFIFWIRHRTEKIDIGYLNINKEFIAQLIWTKFFYEKWIPSSDEIVDISEDLCIKLISYVKPFSILFNYPFPILERHFDISEEDYYRITKSIEKYFNIIFDLAVEQIIIFTKLSEIRWNRQIPFIELWFVPMNKWESYVRLQGIMEKKNKQITDIYYK